MTTIFEKTDAGRQALKNHQLALGRSVRTLLLLIDGRQTDTQLLALLAGQDLHAEAFTQLHALGLITARIQTVEAKPDPRTEPEFAVPAEAAHARSTHAAQSPGGATSASPSLWGKLSQSVRNTLQAREESPRERAAGLAEVVKCAAVADAELFAWLESNLDAVLERDAQALTHMVQRVQALRETIEIADRMEGRVPPHADFGWTLGKVVESLLGYGHYLQGEALALGMVLVTDIGAMQGRQADAVVKRLPGLLQRCGLPLRVPRAPATLWLEALPMDKVGAAGQLRCVLLEDIGKPLSTVVPRSVVVEALERAGALEG